jgi:hypothetical protein
MRLSSVFPTSTASHGAAAAAAHTPLTTTSTTMIDHSESSLGDGCEDDEDDENDHDNDAADSGKETIMVKQVFPQYHQHHRDDDDDGASSGRSKLSAELIPPCNDNDNETDSQCVICYETTPSHGKDHDNRHPCILLPCLHCNCCTSCAEKLEQCHMCRGTIVKVVPWQTTNGGTGIVVRTDSGTSTAIPSWRRRHRRHYRSPPHTVRQRASSADSVEVTLIRHERR